MHRDCGCEPPPAGRTRPPCAPAARLPTPPRVRVLCGGAARPCSLSCTGVKGGPFKWSAARNSQVGAISTRSAPRLLCADLVCTLIRFCGSGVPGGGGSAPYASGLFAAADLATAGTDRQ